jgi:hypothetical protein
MFLPKKGQYVSPIPGMDATPQKGYTYVGWRGKVVNKVAFGEDPEEAE